MNIAKIGNIKWLKNVKVFQLKSKQTVTSEANVTGGNENRNESVGKDFEMISQMPVEPKLRL